MKSVISARLNNVDSGSVSKLPTGALKIKQGILFQEMMVIRHKEIEGIPVGLSYEWQAVDKEFLKALKLI